MISNEMLEKGTALVTDLRAKVKALEEQTSKELEKLGFFNIVGSCIGEDYYSLCIKEKYPIEEVLESGFTLADEVVKGSTYNHYEKKVDDITVSYLSEKLI